MYCIYLLGRFAAIFRRFTSPLPFYVLFLVYRVRLKTQYTAIDLPVHPPHPPPILWLPSDNPCL